MNIISPILAQARQYPTALAVCTPATAQPYISYGRLAAMINNVAHHAVAVGLKSGDTVAIFVDDPVLHLLLTLGLTRAGVVTLSGGVSTIQPEIQVTANLVDATTAATSSASVIPVSAQWLTGDDKPPAEQAAGRGAAVARIVLTSGTTGQPKGVALTHDMITRRIGAFTFAFGDRVAQCSRLFIDISISSNYGFQWMVWTLSRGGAVFLRGAEAAETMQAFSLFKVQGMVASPSGLAEFVKLYEDSPGFICPFDVLVVGGSLMWKSLTDRARARMCSHLVASYGASEISPVAVAPNHQIRHIAGAVGYVCAGIDVETVDESGRALRAGETGALRIRGDVGVGGYLGDPSGSKAAFRDGWFYPGDIGSVTADGVLVIAGRQTAVLNVGGNKVGPETVEQAALAFPGVEQAGAFGVENEFGILEVWLAVVAPQNLDEAGLHRHFQRATRRPIRAAPDLAAGQPAAKCERQAPARTPCRPRKNGRIPETVDNLRY